MGWDGMGRDGTGREKSRDGGGGKGRGETMNRGNGKLCAIQTFSPKQTSRDDKLKERTETDFLARRHEAARRKALGGNRKRTSEHCLWFGFSCSAWNVENKTSLRGR